MAVSRAGNVTSWVLAILLAVAFLIAALGKLTGAAVPMFERWGYPAWFATLIGVAELAGAVGLLVPRVTRWAALGLGAVMLGAAYTHLSAGEGLEVLRPLVFLALLAVVWWLRRPAVPGPGGSA